MKASLSFSVGGQVPKCRGQSGCPKGRIKNSLSCWSVACAALVMVVEMVMAGLIAPFVLKFLYARIAINEKLAPVEHLMAGLFLDEAGR